MLLQLNSCSCWKSKAVVAVTLVAVTINFRNQKLPANCPAIQKSLDLNIFEHIEEAPKSKVFWNFEAAERFFSNTAFVGVIFQCEELGPYILGSVTYLTDT